MEKRWDVFISYSQYDEKYKDQVVKYLEGHGISCWYMTGRIDAGDNWRSEVSQGIRNARCFVMIHSFHSYRSTQVPKEVAIASECGIPKIAFKVDDVPYGDDVAYEFASLQAINAFAVGMPDACEDLRQTVQKVKAGKIKAEKIKPDYSDHEMSRIDPGPLQRQSSYSHQDSPAPRRSRSHAIYFVVLIAAICAIVVVISVSTGKSDESADTSDTEMVYAEEEIEVEEVEGAGEIVVEAGTEEVEIEEAAEAAGEALSSDEEVPTSSGYTAMIYASAVVEFTSGYPWTSDVDAQGSEDILGVPDSVDGSNALTLGGGGEIILQFSAEFTDLEGYDIVIYEVGGAEESVQVLVSADCDTWYTVGKTSGGTEGMDINGYVPAGMYFKYIKLIDQESYTSGTYPGADIDAIGVYIEVEDALDASEEEEAVSTEEALSSDEEVPTSSGYTAMIYASAVVEFTPGYPWTSEADAQRPENILGVPEDVNGGEVLTLGGGGEIILQLPVKFTDLEGYDIVIYETGDDEESVQVLVSADCNTWYTVGKTTGGTEGMDINGYVPEGMYFKYIKLIDQKSQASGTWPGADVDAVGVYIEM